MLNSVALVKSLQWERFVAEEISEAREDELRAQLHRQMITGANTFLSQLSTIGGPVVTFIWYSQVQGETLTAAKVRVFKRGDSPTPLTAQQPTPAVPAVLC